MKQELKSSKEIAEYIQVHSNYDVDQQLIEEYFFGCRAELKEIELNSIILDNENYHIQDKNKQEKYNKMNSTEAPPIVVEKGLVKDGHHRVRAAKYQNRKTIMAYVIVEE